MLYFISLSAKYILSTRDLRGLVQCKSGTIRRFFNLFSILIVGIERPLPSSLNRRCSYKGSAKKLMSSRTLEDKKGVKVLQCSTNAFPKLGDSSTSLHCEREIGLAALSLSVILWEIT